MEKLDVFDCSNVFIASYFTNDRDCAHCNREHTLIYIYSPENWKLRSGSAKRFCGRATALLCGATT